MILFALVNSQKVLWESKGDLMDHLFFSRVVIEGLFFFFQEVKSYILFCGYKWSITEVISNSVFFLLYFAEKLLHCH